MRVNYALTLSNSKTPEIKFYETEKKVFRTDKIYFYLKII